MLQLLLEVLGVEDKNSADIRKVQTESAETLRSNMKDGQYRLLCFLVLEKRSILCISVYLLWLRMRHV